MPNAKWFAVFAITATFTCSLLAENRCPGNVASLPYRLVKGHLMVVEVSINHSGPYNFLLDTGTHLTMVDPSLATSLHLSPEGQMVIASLGSEKTTSLVRVPRIEAGSHTLANQDALVYDMKNAGNTGIDIVGILGEDFLSHFDVLFDNAQRLLCLDDGTAMRGEIKGEHVPLLGPSESPEASLVSLIVSVRLSDLARPVRLKLDTGANESVLFKAPGGMPLRVVDGAGADGAGRAFASMPKQNLKIGAVKLAKVSFVAFAHAKQTSFTSGADGLLSMGLFRRVFIDHADHFVVLEPWSTTLTVLQAEQRCPGNVASIPIRFVGQALFVASVEINDRGPFDFLVDTGAQTVTVDPEMADQLQLHLEGQTGVAGVATYGRKTYTHLEHVRIDTHAATGVVAVIEDLSQLRSVDPRIRGILGEDFLMHFDVLIDNGRHVMCLDDTGAMSREIKGPHVPLEEPYGPKNDIPFTRPLVVAVRLAGSKSQMALLRLDSGSNVPVLFSRREKGRSTTPANVRLLKRVVGGVEQSFAILPPDDVAIGKQTIARMSFVQPLNEAGTSPQSREDGLLPTAIFQRVFISYRDRTLVVTPW